MTAPAITHAFTNPKADGADATIVRPSDWNAAHTLANFSAVSKLLGSGSASATPTEITLGSNLSMSGTTLSASGSNSGPTWPGGLPLTSQKWASGVNVSVSTGDTDLYTVPSNKRALVAAMYLYNASGVGNIVWYPQVKISGTYYRLATNATTANTASGTLAVGYVAEAAEIISINTATNNGGVVFAYILEFDDTCAVKSSKLTSVSAGDNTLYTASGVTATILSVGNVYLLPSAASLIAAVNSSGNPRTYIAKITPSGGSATQVSASANPADGVRSQLSVPGMLQNGDAIVVNSDAATATQFMWATVMEI